MINFLKAPALFDDMLAQTDLEVLRAAGSQADEAGELQADQVAMLHREEWFRMLAPRELGGKELALPQAVRMEEAISHADGSCGWVVTLCAGAGWFAGFLPEPLGRSILCTPKVCLAGSGAPTGFADKDGQGWVLNGHWRHATGSQLATHFTFNAQLRERGLPLLDAQGRPRVRAFVVPAACVQVDQTSWQSIGLRASTSRAFSVDHVRASSDQAFDIEPSLASSPGLLYRFPFEPLALATLAACVSGLACRFVALADALAHRALPRLGGASPFAQAVWETGAQTLAQARTHFYAELDRSWNCMARGEALDSERERHLGEAAHSLVRTARETVDALYPCCGLHAADPRSEINRVWRDLHTATQHQIWLR